MVGIGKGIALI